MRRDKKAHTSYTEWERQRERNGSENIEATLSEWIMVLVQTIRAWNLQTKKWTIFVAVVVFVIVFFFSACSSSDMLSLSYSMHAPWRLAASICTELINAHIINSNSITIEERKMRTIQIKLIHADWFFICLHDSDAHCGKNRATNKRGRNVLLSTARLKNNGWKVEIISTVESFGFDRCRLRLKLMYLVIENWKKIFCFQSECRLSFHNWFY